MPKISPATLKLGAVGKCIYCGGLDELSDEHIIPYSLGGRIVLPKSSCVNCAKVTMKIEQHVSRDHLHIPRSYGNIQTRRKKSRANETTVGLVYPSGKKGKRSFSLDIAPIINIVPTFIPDNADFFWGG